jgi:quercetin dioxygenase-like cupin family protein
MNSQNPFTLPGNSRRGEPTPLRGGDSISCKLSGADTAGRTAIFEGVVSPGAGPVLHVHRTQNEWWYVLDGTFLFQVGNDRFHAAPGASVFDPRGVPHTWRCVTNVPGKMLLAFDRADQIEEFFEEISKIDATLALVDTPRKTCSPDTEWNSLVHPSPASNTRYATRILAASDATVPRGVIRDGA